MDKLKGLIAAKLCPLAHSGTTTFSAHYNSSLRQVSTGPFARHQLPAASSGIEREGEGGEEDGSQIIYYLNSLANLMKNSTHGEDIKEFYIRSNGLLQLMRLLEYGEGDNSSLAHAVLQQVNLLVENNPQIQEKACLMGLLPLILKYGGAEYARELRIEVAYFIGLACQYSRPSL